MSSGSYTVFPRVAALGAATDFQINSIYPQADLRLVKGKIRLEYIADSGLLQDGSLPGFTCGNGFDMGRDAFNIIENGILNSANGILHFNHAFHTPGEHTIRLTAGDEILEDLEIYILDESLIDLRPLRGDMHLHTGYSCCCSDQKKLSPEYYVALNCLHGLDFIGISDHKQRDPSLKAEIFAEKCDGNFKAYPCEEVHMPTLHNLHMLNFGSSGGVSEIMRLNTPGFQKELAKCVGHVPGEPEYWVKMLMAHHEWVHKKIAEFGGLSVFCHPFWRPQNRYFMPQVVLEYVMENRFFDALEVFGGAELREMNDKAAALHNEYCIKKGDFIPVVGNTDLHTPEFAGVNNTIVFAENNSREKIIDAVKKGFSVAVSFFAGEFPRTAGRVKLVKYYHFLRRNYYPHHDRIAAKEGGLFLAALESAVPDDIYAEFITRSYPERHDGTVKISGLKFDCNAEGFAAVKAERREFDRRFFQGF